MARLLQTQTNVWLEITRPRTGAKRTKERKGWSGRPRAAWRLQWRVSPKRGSSSPRSPKASLAFLAGEKAASGIMSAQAARALDASHHERHPPRLVFLPLTGISPWSRRASKTNRTREHSTRARRARPSSQACLCQAPARFQRNRRVGALCVEIGLNAHANWPGKILQRRSRFWLHPA